MNQEELIKELSGEDYSSKEEIEELTFIANNLSKFSQLKLSLETKRDFLEKIEKRQKTFSFWKYIFIPALSSFLLIFLISTPFVLAQNSLPGENLYGLKKITENIVITVKPELKDDVVVRRSQEVKEVIEKKKEPKTVKEALREYEKEIDRKTADNEKTREHVEKSLKNLREAKEKTDDENKKQIEEVIQKTKREDSHEKVKSEKTNGEKDQNKRED